MVLERLRRRRAEPSVEPRPPHLSFGVWSDLPTGSVVQVCHPDWRGVRSAAYAFRSPVVECDNLRLWGGDLAARMRERSVRCVVIQGWPPGAEYLIHELARTGVTVKCVLHSSPALQGEVPAEAEVVATAFSLAQEGSLTEVAMVKAGVAEAFTALGHPVTYLPNRAPDVTGAKKVDLGPGFHIGIFGDPWWPKNILTQVLAAGLIDNALVHLSRPLEVPYVSGIPQVIHQGLRGDEFLGVLGSMDLNLNVSLTECHPMLPIESYLLGVPCLISRTSSVFKTDPELWAMTTVDELDNPLHISNGAASLLAGMEIATRLARAWIAASDQDAGSRWSGFTA